MVGSFNFPESVTLAYLYADALAGLDAEVELGNLDPQAVARQWLRAAGLAQKWAAP